MRNCAERGGNKGIFKLISVTHQIERDAIIFYHQLLIGGVGGEVDGIRTLDKSVGGLKAGDVVRPGRPAKPI